MIRPAGLALGCGGPWVDPLSARGVLPSGRITGPERWAPAPVRNTDSPSDLESGGQLPISWVQQARGRGAVQMPTSLCAGQGLGPLRAWIGAGRHEAMARRLCWVGSGWSRAASRRLARSQGADRARRAQMCADVHCSPRPGLPCMRALGRGAPVCPQPFSMFSLLIH